MFHEYKAIGLSLYYGFQWFRLKFLTISCDKYTALRCCFNEFFRNIERGINMPLIVVSK